MSKLITSGTIYIDDFESRRLSYIGMLPDPGLMPDPEAPDQASWAESVYTYEPSRPQAVTAVDRPGTDSTTLTYDANGNTTCRVEVVGAATTTWGYVYNDENRLWKIHQVSGTCATPNPCQSGGRIR